MMRTFTHTTALHVIAIPALCDQCRRITSPAVVAYNRGTTLTDKLCLDCYCGSADLGTYDQHQ